jgi:hypothetical protein
MVVPSHRRRPAPPPIARLVVPVQPGNRAVAGLVARHLTYAVLTLMSVLWTSLFATSSRTLLTSSPLESKKRNSWILKKVLAHRRGPGSNRSGLSHALSLREFTVNRQTAPLL